MLRAASLLTALTHLCASQAVAQEDSFDSGMRGFLAEHCALCHDDFEPEADLNLSRFASREEALSDPEVWFAVEERLLAGDMPPKSQERPPQAEVDVDAVLHAIEPEVDFAD
ncbi:MAG: hypothetical protein MK291_05200, partial [Planctomycetes bacterium]|nr:hypothetical protein [Planctomycetota bacterium]